MKRNEKQEAKRVDANNRTTVSSKLTPHQQLAKLDERLGKGVGATRERQKLTDIIEYMDSVPL